MSASKPSAIPYFVLSSVVTRTTARLANRPNLPPGSDLWIYGQKLAGVIPRPIVFDIDPGDEGEMGAFIRTAAPLMSNALVEALRAAGVDNFETYEVLIRELATGKEYMDYSAVNVLGAIDAVDRAKSKSTSLEGLGTWFTNLVLDESLTRGALMFRLQQSLSKIIVHRRVKEIIENRNLPLLLFRPVDGLSG